MLIVEKAEIHFQNVAFFIGVSLGNVTMWSIQHFFLIIKRRNFGILLDRGKHKSEIMIKVFGENEFTSIVTKQLQLTTNKNELALFNLSLSCVLLICVVKVF